MARTSKFISQPTDDQLSKFPKEVQELVKKGKGQGFITQQELLKAMPNVEEDLILLDELTAW
ncbi:MAG: RNA polymerase sigma factor region1.1 domain-containing protein, partial [Candidatus Gracilibacteria bacterium]